MGTLRERSLTAVATATVLPFWSAVDEHFTESTPCGQIDILVTSDVEQDIVTHSLPNCMTDLLLLAVPQEHHIQITTIALTRAWEVGSVTTLPNINELKEYLDLPLQGHEKVPLYPLEFKLLAKPPVTLTLDMASEEDVGTLFRRSNTESAPPFT
ncbi:hypothetical protein FRB94_003963 [Tulasnella sp. JGI-2019a]|nr:hypothetical protein FRB94_003963 [Tulasnella sp. JGI-2019a]